MAQRPYSVDVSETVLKEFLNNQPSFYEEEKVTLAFCQCICQTLFNLYTISPQAGTKYIPSILSMLQEVLQVKDTEKFKQMQSFAVKTYELVFINCVKPALWRGGQDMQTETSSDADIFQIGNMDIMDEEEAEQQKQEENKQRASVFQRIVIILGYMFSAQFDQVQKHVLTIIGSFYERLDESCAEQVQDLIMKTIQTRKTTHMQNWEKCMGQLIGAIGVNKLIELCPISLQNEDALSPQFEDDNNLWLASLILKYSENQSIDVFLRSIWPIIRQAQAIIQRASTEQSALQVRVYRQLELQLWACLPNLSSISKHRSKQEYESAQLFLK